MKKKLDCSIEENIIYQLPREVKNIMCISLIFRYMSPNLNAAVVLLLTYSPFPEDLIYHKNLYLVVFPLFNYLCFDVC